MSGNLKMYEGMMSKNLPRHNEVSRTIEVGGRGYNISSGDNDRQMTMTEQEARNVARKRGYGTEYKNVGSAVKAAVSESRESGMPKNAIEMYFEHKEKK